jgi:hypothetical protein
MCTCCLVETARCFRVAYCLHHQGDFNIQEGSHLRTSALDIASLKQRNNIIKYSRNKGRKTARKITERRNKEKNIQNTTNLLPPTAAWLRSTVNLHPRITLSEPRTISATLPVCSGPVVIKLKGITTVFRNKGHDINVYWTAVLLTLRSRISSK